MNIKYTIGSIIAIPLLPFLYLQGKRIKRNIPDLPEASGDTGFCTANNKESLRLLTIGESTIAGVGVDTHEEGFSGTLAKEISQKLDVDVYWKVYAKSGYTAKQVNEQIIDNIEDKSADLIVIGLGGNDAFQLNRPKKWKKAIRLIIKNLKLKFTNTPIVFINMPPIKDFPVFTLLARMILGNYVNILGEELNNVVKTYDKVYYISNIMKAKDMAARISNSVKPSDMFSDGVHPSKMAYQIWARDVAEYIIKTIPNP
ncbi:hypothetical protein EZS27_006132 [termite gut metagenome]|uniref:SGNH hydrolase-type esterase domain-containing protein n=1 Tax=termite gut metagenome TaxID=433724 RepID=A0A5J4SKA8_9ZZZZ